MNFKPFYEWREFILQKDNPIGVEKGLLHWVDNVLPKITKNPSLAFKISENNVLFVNKVMAEYLRWRNHFLQEKSLTAVETNLINWQDDANVDASELARSALVEECNRKDNAIQKLKSDISQLQCELNTMELRNKGSMLHAFISGMRFSNVQVDEKYINFLAGLYDREFISFEDLTSGKISIKWIVGGRAGGNCWGDEANINVKAEEEPDFIQFEEIIRDFDKNIRFSKFKEVQKQLIHEKGNTVNEYYGNYTEYAEKYVLFRDLYEFWMKTYNSNGKSR
ncbi:MAG TPA: hypothetical protein VMT35_00710 [Ignavibacteriaceae bacterium]|nr:hypothetical protein [Ignavibacteriaceae bacterium]